MAQDESEKADHYRRRQYAQTGSKSDVRMGRQRDMDRHKVFSRGGKMVCRVITTNNNTRE
jgi:hypothetical protein